MGTAIIIGILAVIVVLALISSVKNMKGEGGCCGGGGDTVAEEKKTLDNPVIAVKTVDIEGKMCIRDRPYRPAQLRLVRFKLGGLGRLPGGFSGGVLFVKGKLPFLCRPVFPFGDRFLAAVQEVDLVKPLPVAHLHDFTLETVSYTHLDVYKRQTLCKSLTVFSIIEGSFSAISLSPCIIVLTHTSMNSELIVF